MNAFEAFILGLIQGLTEFLPVSSSGHIEIGKAILGVDLKEELSLTIIVHGATVLSTLVVFRKDIIHLLVGLFTCVSKRKINEETTYVAKLLLSMVPVAFIGFFFKDYIETLFGNGLFLVGCMLLLTAALLAFAYYKKAGQREISFRDALIIGLAQACAVLPGLSRSGSTIATGLLLGNNKASMARFSFLMVLIPILGENLLNIIEGDLHFHNEELFPLSIAFVTAFVSGLIACRWMIKLVKSGKLIYFAVYCTLAGVCALVF